LFYAEIIINELRKKNKKYIAKNTVIDKMIAKGEEETKSKKQETKSTLYNKIGLSHLFLLILMFLITALFF